MSATAASSTTSGSITRTAAAPPPPDLGEAANNIATSINSLGAAWRKAAIGISEAKRWFVAQYAEVERHDDKIHKFVMVILAVEILYFKGPWSIGYFAVGYVADAVFSDKLKDLVDKVKDKWLHTKTIPLATFALGMLILPTYRWTIASAAFGAYCSHISKPVPADEREFELVEGDAGSEHHPVQQAEPGYNLVLWALSAIANMRVTPPVMPGSPADQERQD